MLGVDSLARCTESVPQREQQLRGVASPSAAVHPSENDRFQCGEPRQQLSRLLGDVRRIGAQPELEPKDSTRHCTCEIFVRTLKEHSLHVLPFSA